MAVEERNKERREKKSMIIVVPSCQKDADGARTCSDQNGVYNWSAHPQLKPSVAKKASNFDTMLVPVGVPGYHCSSGTLVDGELPRNRGHRGVHILWGGLPFVPPPTKEPVCQLGYPPTKKLHPFLDNLRF